jgi:glutathione S-transferase
MTGPGSGLPLLWQLRVSHFSEKARWALDFKRVDHVRRAPLPGLHMLVALARTGGAATTLPVLELDGERIADSTAVIAALEARFPDRPLYPADPAERQRALALEDHFDEGLGPAARHVVFHELGREPRLLGEIGSYSVTGPLSRATVLLGAYARVFTAARYGVADDDATATAREAVIAALDRLEAELSTGDGEHLVGSGFTVADLTAAALFYPLVNPVGGPLPPGLERPAPLAEFIASIAARPGYRWVEETYRRYRAPATARTAAAPTP